jgi:MYXO-CTERM domain-containing protein
MACAMSSRRRSYHRVLSAFTLLGLATAAATWSVPALGNCVAPEPKVVFSYPDAATGSIPPDAVIWAIAADGPASVAIDGVPLPRRGDEAPDNGQFVPAAPLPVGPHELTITMGNAYSYDVPAEDLTVAIPFEVSLDAASASSGDVAITRVERHPIVTSQSGDRLSPTGEVFDQDCSADSVELQFNCFDTGGPFAITRIELATDPTALRYLFRDTAGYHLLPPTCTAFVTYDYFGARDSYSISALLPTGLGPETASDAGIDVIATANDSGSCSASPGSPRRVMWGLVVSGLAVAALLRRRNLA